MSENITVTAVMDNLFEEDESFEVSVTAISSNYVSCADGGCNPQISITQNPSDGELLSIVHGRSNKDIHFQLTSFVVFLKLCVACNGSGLIHNTAVLHGYIVLICTCMWLSCMHLCTVPTLSLDTSSVVIETEGEVINVCATLSGIPSSGLECDIVLQLQTTPGPMDPGTLANCKYFNLLSIICTFPSAVEGMDYTLEGDFQIVFGSSVIDGSSNSSTGCAQINLTADNLLEESEFFTVMVTLVTPANVNGDVSQIIEVQINDNDGKD